MSGPTPCRRGAGFIPPKLTRAQVEQYVKEHPDQKAAIYDQFTIVRWHRTGNWKRFPITLRTARSWSRRPKLCARRPNLSDDPAFANFLRLRADALLSDDYFASDLAWLDLKNPKFDIIFAPYETYMDGLLGREGFLRRGGDGAQRA